MFAKIKATDLARILPFCATNDVRYYLDGVYVEPQEKGCLLVATNGHVLGAILSESSEAERAFIMTATKPLRSLVKRYAKPDTEIRIETDKSYVELFARPTKRSMSQTIYIQPGRCEIDAKYPDWRKIIPSEDKLVPGLPGAYRPDYLHAALAAVATMPGDRYGNAMRISHIKDHPEDNAAFFHFGGLLKSLLVIVMPMRHVEGISLPQWTRPPVPIGWRKVA